MRRVTAATDFDRTRIIQREASDPAVSAWVVANAGSGKTHVLTQRVIRLLLAGVEPAAILCLTFTKVAAAEMARRVFETLGEWALLPDEALRRAVASLQGAEPTVAEMRQARRLFALALETPGGLKIQTIHAFCEGLLHQFPFEANVPGRFAVLDDNGAQALLSEARAAVMNEAATEPETRLGRALRYMAENATDQAMGEALDALIAARGRMGRWMELEGPGEGSAVDGALADLRRRLGLQPEETEEAICAAICAGTGWGCADCHGLAEALRAGNATDRAAELALRSIHAAGLPSIEADRRIGFFLTGGNDGWKPRSTPHRFSRAARDGRAGLEDDFTAESERLLGLVTRLDLARAYAATEALLVVGDAILEAYGAAKRRAGMLDFADLIAKVKNLLSRADASSWVLYKLDRRIDHILVDEAQDTSPDQWAIVQGLAQEFFSGAGARAQTRTIFAVGDEKQSIFRFQGAEPRMLAEMQRFFEKRVREAGSRFSGLPLYLSFRSTREVLDAVDAVFGRDYAAKITDPERYHAHASNRPADPGRVILLPRTVRRRSEEPENWTDPFDAPTAAETELARSIAEEIGRLRGSTLPSGKRVREGEILVLVRKRDAFAAAMHRALRDRGIGTAGADRIPVATHIAVLDLLALADVMLLPEDDLQLAACLKSPLIGLTEDELMHLALGRKGSLWSALRNAPEMWFRQAAERLRGWQTMADQVTPFRFFATVLGPDGGRRAFRARLGAEADDILDALLSQALSYEAYGPPSLQGFIGFIRANQSDIKREKEEASAGVRVMTVHGAKGLEADVVFLVDTGGMIVVPGQREKLVPIGAGRDDPAFLWRRNSQCAPDCQREADAAGDEETRREYLRLLYVAMTRARDVLYVAGIRGERTPEEYWYSAVAGALLPADLERDPETGELAAPFVWPQPSRPPLDPKSAAEAVAEAPGTAPPWLLRPAPSPLRPPEPLRPSRALAEPDPLPDGGARSSQPGSRDEALLRGSLVHRLLQNLPAVPEAARKAYAERMLLRELPDMPELSREIRTEAEAVLAAPELGPFFGPGSRAEVPIVGQLRSRTGEFAVSGQIDRLLRTAEGWRVLDFKTNRAVPDTVEEVPADYVLQLALYRRLLLDMEPGGTVEAAIVWTAGPKLMPIPEAFMERALEKLGVAAIPFA